MKDSIELLCLHVLESSCGLTFVYLQHERREEKRREEKRRVAPSLSARRRRRREEKCWANLRLVCAWVPPPLPFSGKFM